MSICIWPLIEEAMIQNESVGFVELRSTTDTQRRRKGQTLVGQ